MTTKSFPRSRDGRYAVTGSRWDHNGSHHVSVIGPPPAGDAVADRLVARHAHRVVRDLARRIDPMPASVRWTRIEETRVIATPEGSRTTYRVTVSRLNPGQR